MKTILVPTDFSASSQAASDFAAVLARKKNLELCFIHVVEIPASPESIYYLNHEVIQRMMTDAQEKLHELSEQYRDIKDVKTFVTTSNALEGISKGILTIDADLIVVGKHKITGPLSNLFFENHSEKIIQYANCPVISVPNDMTPGLWQNALVAIDPESCPDELLEKTYNICSTLGLTPKYVWITNSDQPPSEEQLSLLNDTLKDHYPGKSFHFDTYQSNDIVDGILSFARKNNVDLILTSTHQRTGLSRILHRSVAGGVLDESDRPLMILHLNKISENRDKIVA